MSTNIFSNFINLFGFIGLAAIGILPLRIWITLLHISKKKNIKPQEKILTGLSLIFIAAAILSEATIVDRIFRCLTKNYCGPLIASGWIYLAAFGAVYLIFEIAIFTLGKIRPKPCPEKIEP